jgi:hypothetical protein
VPCDSGGCVDEAGTNSTNQSIANQLCADREANGCGEPINSDPMDEPLDEPEA